MRIGSFLLHVLFINTQNSFDNHKFGRKYAILRVKMINGKNR